jgi:CelD/BcsL family acetyltransferase involved in cellulose biosynthesis
LRANTIDALARSAEPAPDRRAALKTAGAATIGAILAAPAAAGARRNDGKKGHKKARKRCKRQVRQCRAFVLAECADDQECQATFLRCCGFLATCNAGATLRCLFPTPDER